MESSITTQVRLLCDDLRTGLCSVQQFQFRLEILLGSYRVVSKKVGAGFRCFVNDLELILYTIPKDQQRDRATRVADAVIKLIEKECL